MTRYWQFYNETSDNFIYQHIEDCCGLVEYKVIDKHTGKVSYEY